MDEQLFLKQLSIQLKELPKEAVDEIIADYASYFSQARKSGLTDEEAIENLGHPREIVQEILAKHRQQSSNPSKARTILLAIALIFFNLTIVLGPALGLIGAFLGMFLAVVIFIFSPLLVMGKFIFANGSLFELFMSIFICGLGIILVPYFKLGAVMGYEFLRKYIQWNKTIIKGGALR